ncbi:MAG TPA: glycine zipper 2TM domain-containing protein [Rhizomicrobium sp.]|nr:glycine zipper 2TM domain-containing protein [Rhizomicrobium sp.]
MKPTLVAVLLALGLACTADPAFADACSGKDHTAGTIAGGVLGGVLGGVFTNGKALGIAGGALLGGLAGNAIARDMDCQDQPYAARAYGQSFRGPVGRRYEWSRGRNRGYVVTNREYNRGPRLCRDFTQVVYRRGREFDRAGTACRRRDGEWEFLS